MPNNILELVSVSKQYAAGQSHTISEFTLSIKENEFVSIIGPSGCGKTTILKLISGLEKPSSGDIFINGQNVTAHPANKRGVNLVFQGYSLYPHMTVFENLSFPLRIKGMKKTKIQSKVNDILSILEISQISRYFPRHISGGQQQRVAIGRALAKDSKVLLMDEPLSNLDPEMRSKLRNELKNLIEKLNLTVVYVTHDQTEALTLSDKIVFLNKGVIKQIDSPVKFQENPRDIIVASFFAFFPLNVFICSFKDGVCQFLGKRIKLKSKYTEDQIMVVAKSEHCKIYSQDEYEEGDKKGIGDDSYVIHGKIGLVEVISIHHIYHLIPDGQINPETNFKAIPEQFFAKVNQSFFYAITDRLHRLKRNIRASIVFDNEALEFFNVRTGDRVL